MRRVYVKCHGWDGYLHDGGYIERIDVLVPPTINWRALCIRRRNNFGYEVERIRLECDTCGAERMDGIQWRYKNGKPRWTLVDMDHGTIREYPILDKCESHYYR